MKIIKMNIGLTIKPDNSDEFSIINDILTGMYDIGYHVNSDRSYFVFGIEHQLRFLVEKLNKF